MLHPETVESEQISQSDIAEHSQVAVLPRSEAMAAKRVEPVAENRLARDVHGRWLHSQNQRQDVVPAGQIVRREQEVTVRLEHPQEFSEKTVGVVQVLQELIRVDDVESAIREWKNPIQIVGHDADPARLCLRYAGLHRLDSPHLPRLTRAGDPRGELTIATPAIEQAASGSALGKRQDSVVVGAFRRPKETPEIGSSHHSTSNHWPQMIRRPSATSYAGTERSRRPAAEERPEREYLAGFEVRS